MNVAFSMWPSLNDWRCDWCASWEIVEDGREMAASNGAGLPGTATWVRLSRPLPRGKGGVVFRLCVWAGAV